MAQQTSDNYPVLFDVTSEEWEALKRRGKRNTRWPEQEAGAIVRRIIRRDLEKSEMAVAHASA